MLKPLYCADKYSIDSDGFIVLNKTLKPLKIYTNSSGYNYSVIDIEGHSKTVIIHTAVMRTFEPEGWKQGYEVNHKDGNKSHNNLNNLEWVTRQENIRHASEVLHRWTGKNNSQATPITAINVITKEQTNFDCIADAAREIAPNIESASHSIWRVLKGYRKTYKKYFFVYNKSKISQ